MGRELRMPTSNNSHCSRAQTYPTCSHGNLGSVTSSCWETALTYHFGYLWGGKRIGRRFENLALLKDLQQLRLLQTGITDVSMKTIEPSNLAESATRLPRYNRCGISPPCALKELEDVQLRGTNITDMGIEFLRRSTRLRFLSLHGTKISDAGVKRLVSFPELEYLDIGNTEISDSVIESLANIRLLKRLEVGITDRLTLDGVGS